MSNDLLAVRRPKTCLATITPSGNVVVERVTQAILASFPGVSGHFSRVEVVGSADAYADDYDWDGMLRAATLLSHIKPDVICWNGSKGGSLGFDFDRRLCDRITQRTGIQATTSTLVLHAVLKRRRMVRLGLVTPYTAAYAAKIPPNFAAEGFEVVAEAHAGESDNLSYAAIPDGDILAMVRQVAAAKPDAILTYCTNLPAAHLVDAAERELGIPWYDSVSAGVYGALRAAKCKTGPGWRWGTLFGQDM